MTESVSKPDVVKIAKSRRHLKMMEDLQQGKTLTPAQIRELAEYEGGGEADPGILATQEQIAKVFRVTVRTVRNWIESGMPVMKTGRYDLAEIVAWKFMRDQAVLSEGRKSDDWVGLYRECKAKIEEIKLWTIKGNVIPKQEVEQGLVQVSIAIKRALLALPRAIAPRLVGLEPREIEAVLRERVEEIINLFAKDLIFGKTGKSGGKAGKKTKNLDR